MLSVKLVRHPPHQAFDGGPLVAVSSKEERDAEQAEQAGQGDCYREWQECLPVAGWFAGRCQAIDPERPDVNGVMQQVERERMTAEDAADVGCSCSGLVVAGTAVGPQID